MGQDNVVGIVVEYNPFHNGHKYQIQKIKEQLPDASIVAIMSPSFTQRGDIAIKDKWQRTSWALENGVDLVLELPTIYSLRSAEYFAKGAIDTLQKTSIITHLAFGCETDDVDLLLNLAKENISKAEYDANLSKGVSYATLTEKILVKRNKNYKKLLHDPNNILALEYLKALKTFKSSILPLPIQRTSNNFNSSKLTGALSSASAIRTVLEKEKNITSIKNTVPKDVFQSLREEKNYTKTTAKLELLLNYKINSLPAHTLATYCDVSEGLENKIKKAANCFTLAEMLEEIKSKRYPVARIKRLLMQILISSPSVPFCDTKDFSASYIRVLGFTDTGRKVLKEINKKALLPILTKIKRDALKDTENLKFTQTLQTEINATNLYDLINGRNSYGRDYTTSPLYKKLLED